MVGRLPLNLPGCFLVALASLCTETVLMLVKRRRRWANIKPPLVQRLVFAGMPESRNTLSTLPEYLTLKHTITLFSLSDHCILSREWRVIVDLVQTNYHGRLMVLKSVRYNRTVDHEESSLCLKSVKTLGALHS